MFFILKTVVLARVLQIFRACGALFLSTRFLQAFCNVRVCCPARKSNVIKFQSNSALTIAADSADIVSFCACVESAVAARKSNVTKHQRAIHTVKRVLCMSLSDLRSSRKSSISCNMWGQKLIREVSHRSGWQNARMTVKLVEHVHEVEFMLPYVF